MTNKKKRPLFNSIVFSKMKSYIHFISREEIEEKIRSLIEDFGYAKIIPVPIEDILDLDLEMDITYISGLKKSFYIESFLTSDLTTIYVDEDIYWSYPYYFRYLIAHELGHRILHGGVFEKYKFKKIDEWKEFLLNIDDKALSWLESQAHMFAGLILVPPAHLKRHVKREIREHRELIEEAKNKGLKKHQYLDFFILFISSNLSKIFKVPNKLIDSRIKEDNLDSFIP